MVWGANLWYTKHTFEGIEEYNQADKKSERGQVYHKYRLYQSGSGACFRAVIYGFRRR